MVVSLAAYTRSSPHWFTNVGSPFFMQPGQWIPGWGVGVNVIELKMFDDKGNPAGFCIDDIVIDYHPLEDKK